jgi:hypothetical protein
VIDEVRQREYRKQDRRDRDDANRPWCTRERPPRPICAAAKAREESLAFS